MDQDNSDMFDGNSSSNERRRIYQNFNKRAPFISQIVTNIYYDWQPPYFIITRVERPKIEQDLAWTPEESKLGE